MSKKENLIAKIIKLVCWSLVFIFSTLKILGYVEWSWLVISLPILIPVGLSTILFILAEVIDAICALKSR
jgi:hypothetical protein